MARLSFSDLMDVWLARSSPRRQYLFACACLWLVEEDLTPAQRQRWLENYDALEADAFNMPCPRPSWDHLIWDPLERAVAYLLRSPAGMAATVVSQQVGHHLLRDQNPWDLATYAWPFLVPLLEDVGGPTLIQPLANRIISWNDWTPFRLALAAYDNHAPASLPILADALQEAGCDSAQLLDHLRALHPRHTRGCWALDLILRRQ
jgi:hypothetical protein